MNKINDDDKYYMQNTIAAYFSDKKDVRYSVTLDLENRSMTISITVWAGNAQYLKSDCRKYVEEAENTIKEALGLEHSLKIFGDVRYEPEEDYSRSGILFYQIDDEFIDKIYALTIIHRGGNNN